MGQRSGIEWTDATWNPVTGCTRVTAGCDNCYAAVLAHRLLKDTYLAREPQVDSDITRRDPFAVRLWPERLEDPLRWREPRQIFVNSMSDLFHKDIPDDFVRRVFAVMQRADWHVYQVLTKRPGRALRFVELNLDLFEDGTIPGHIWIGTSVENQEVVYRIRRLRQVRARARIKDTDEVVETSTLGVLGQEVPFTKYIFVDSDPRCIEALDARIHRLDRGLDVDLIGDLSVRSPPKPSPPPP